MKILKIEFENLNSLRGTQTINLEFGELAEAGIFAITGPTGAGKSTILDAITLALYGRAARYGSSPSPENMMSRHTGFCRSEIVFETPAGRFRSAWSLNRARKKPDGKPQSAKHQVFDQNETPLTQKIKETADKIEELIGLDFDRFLRSVLLAQGEFAKFLKSDIKERGRLLESLTGTRIYSDLSQLVYEQHKSRDSQLKEREAKLDAVVLLGEDERKDKIGQSKKLADELKSLNKKLKAARTLVELGNQWRETTDAKQQLTTTLKSLKERGKALAADEQRLKSHQKAFAFKPNMGQLNQLQTQCNDSEKQVRRAVEQTEASGQTLKLQLQHANAWLTGRDKELQKKLDAESKQQTKWKKEQTQITTWLAENAADKALVETIPNLRTGLGKLDSSRRTGLDATTRLKTLAEATKKTEAAIKQQTKEFKTLETTIKEQQAALTKQQELLAKELDGKDPKNLNDQRDDLTKKIAALTTMSAQQNETSQLKKEIAAKQAAIKQRQDDTKTHEQTVKHVVQTVESQEEVCAALELALEQARQFAELSDHRANLKDGEACPLCGSLEHPAVDGETTSSLKSVQKQFDTAREKLTKLKSEQQLQSNQLTQAKATLKSELQVVKSEQDRLAKHELSLNQQATQSGLSTEETKNLAATQAAAETQLEKFKQRMLQVDALRQSVQTCEQIAQKSLNDQGLLAQSLESDQDKINDLKSQQQEATERLEAANIDVQTQTGQLDKMLEPFQLTTPEPSTVDAFQESLDQRSQAFQIQTKELAKLETQLTDSQQTAKELQRDQQETENGLERLKTWADEEALRSVRLPAAADTRKATTWSTVPELLDELGSLRTAWQQTADREQGHKEAASKNHAALQSTSAAFLAKVVQGGFESIEQLKATLLSDEAAEKIANDLEQHKERLNKTQGQLEQLEKTLTSLKDKSAPNEQELVKQVAELEQAENEAGQKQQQRTTIENALDADLQQRKKQEQAHKELQDERQQLATWQRMNEIMGSADGQKFRTFAQGISLDLVIRHANLHLSELSKRYRLQRRAADSLGLEICDLHQANALRPMESLSGGESFVVSLALALGLSDLAGQSVRIDSLFIDEGFGTLDPETLDMAVAALERLQARNKTIGVISHVELLKERITTQIQVQPIAGGISELKIVA